MSTVPAQHARDDSSLEIAPYRPGEEHAILSCMRTCFGVDPALPRWRHLHLENPCGPSLIALARNGDDVVAHLACLRRRMRAFGEEVLGGHVIDTMTHPEWQRRGLYGRLAAVSARLGAAADLAATYGVTNATARHGSIKYEGRQPLGPFPVLVRPVRPVAAAATFGGRLLGVGTDARAEIPDCAAAGPLAAEESAAVLGVSAGNDWSRPRFDARHSRLFAAVEGLPAVAFVRDAAYLGWRYPMVPSSPYRQLDVRTGGEIAATVVVRVAPLAGLRFLFVMEWHWRAGERSAAHGLAREVVRLARRAGVHAVAAMARAGTPHRRVLRRLGFLPIPESVFPKSAWPGVRPEGRFARDARWLEPRHWYFTFGDGLIL